MKPNRAGAPRACHWDIDGLRLHGLAWGPDDGLPVLALHGWMDHAGSFQELAPRLDGCHVVALDLSGQGLSDHRAAHATYNIWDDLPQIVGVLEQLGWDRCVILGHSRGAIIGTLLAAAQPGRVRALVALDALLAEPIAEDRVVATLRAFIDETRQRRARPPRLFADRAAYVARRGEQGNAPHISAALADRALEPTEDGYRMRGDARLFASSAMKLTQGQAEAVMRALACPVLNIWADEGLKSRRPASALLTERARALIADYTALDLPGEHHFHLDPAHVGPVAAAIREFLAQRL